MTKYRFVGTESHIGQVKLERFGQAFNIDEKLAEQALRAGVALMPDEEFQAIGFTPSQLKIWADPFMPLFEIPDDPAEAKDKEDFMRKRDAALAKCHEIRQGLLERLAAEAAAPVSPADAEDHTDKE